MSDNEIKTLSGEEFAADATGLGPALRGYIAMDRDRPDVVLYGRSTPRCPRIPIPRSIIARIERGRSLPCLDGQIPRVRTMWQAVVHLKSPMTPETELIDALIAEFETTEAPTAAAASCGCESSSVARLAVAASTDQTLGDETAIEVLASCVELRIENGKACLRVPYAGDVCIGVPGEIPNGTLARACIDVCKRWQVPCGVKVEVFVGDQKVAGWKKGCC